MILVFGGAYQGKLEYVLNNLSKSKTVFDCSVGTIDIDFNCEVINNFHFFILNSIKNKIDINKYIVENIENLKDKIIITDDISCGVVPIDKEDRLWREIHGKSMTKLSKNADEVYRVFCGLGIQIK